MKGKGKHFLITGLAFALLLAFFVSPFASKAPDGLEKVAGKNNFLNRENSIREGSLFTDYLFPGIENSKLAKGLAGLTGTLIVFIVGFLFVYALKRFTKNGKKRITGESSYKYTQPNPRKKI